MTNGEDDIVTGSYKWLGTDATVTLSHVLRTHPASARSAPPFPVVGGGPCITAEEAWARLTAGATLVPFAVAALSFSVRYVN